MAGAMAEDLLHMEEALHLRSYQISDYKSTFST